MNRRNRLVGRAAKRKSFEWRQLFMRALLTHQDEMKKVDLPHAVVESSFDLSRWRYNVNAQVNAAAGNAKFFSLEQGSGAKFASYVNEAINLDHIVTCNC